jgi:hypothetical protein
VATVGVTVTVTVTVNCTAEFVPELQVVQWSLKTVTLASLKRCSLILI